MNRITEALLGEESGGALWQARRAYRSSHGVDLESVIGEVCFSQYGNILIGETKETTGKMLCLSTTIPEEGQLMLEASFTELTAQERLLKGVVVLVIPDPRRVSIAEFDGFWSGAFDDNVDQTGSYSLERIV